MSLKKIIFLYIFCPVFIALLFAEFWVRHEDLVGLGTDRIPHPYLEIGGFYRGGYFNDPLSPTEAPEAFGYKNKTWMNVPSFEYGTPVRSASDRGGFLYRDRADRVITPKPKDEFRIFILGGSVAFGEGASAPDKRWFIQLEKILREKTKKNIVVIPAANHSHVTTQERIILDLYVAPFEPDLLIFLDGFNDANTGVFAVRPGDPCGQSILYARDFSPFFSWLTDLSKHSSLLRFVMQKTLARVWFPEANPEKDKAQAQSVASVYYDNLSQMKHRCTIENFKCLFFLQPYWDQTLANRKLKPLPERDLVVMNYNEIKNQLKDHPFVIDYTGVFDQEPVQMPFYDSAHFHDSGHRFIAEKMAEYILQKNIIR